MRGGSFVLVLIGALGACGDGATAPDAADHDAAPIDALVPDAWPCAPDESAPACDNCIDDDGDGKVDGWDLECSGGHDNDEGSFDIGVADYCMAGPLEDCFFDGNSGGGDDGCRVTEPASDACRAFCEPLTAPDCDCFGCCTICENGICTDRLLDVCTAPDCDGDNLAECPSCTQRTDCLAQPGPPCLVSADCAPNHYCARGTCIALAP